MIDLSTLIALLTALASATAPHQTGPYDAPQTPPAQYCQSPDSGSARQDGVDRSGAYDGATRPSGDGWTGGTVNDSAPSTTTRQLRSDDPDKTGSNKTGSNKTDPDKTDPDKTDADKTDADKTDPDKTDEADGSDEPDGSADRDRSAESHGSDGNETSSTGSRAETPEPRSTTPARPGSAPTAPSTTRPGQSPPDREQTPRGTPATQLPRSAPGTTPEPRSGTQAGPGARPTAPGPSSDPAPGNREPSVPPSRRTDDRYRDDPSCTEPPAPRTSDPTDNGPDNRQDNRPDSGGNPTSGEPTTNLEFPSDLVDVESWYLTLPTGAKGDPDTIQPNQLVGYSSDYFRLNRTGNGVVFTAPVDGATTRNSSYPRSELREMSGADEAAWSNTSGAHRLRATEAVTELPEAKPEIVTAQIHDGSDDVMQIRLERNHLMVQYADGAKQVTLDPNYQLGTPYDIEILAAANSVQVAYNGEPKAELPLSGSSWYFKAGAYVQSNPTKGDAAAATGQVIIYSLHVEHR